MKSRNPQLVLTLFLIGINLFIACALEAQQVSSWSSMYPLSVPLDVRQAEFAKGNIVPNPSFEEGKNLQNDSLIKNFKINGWEKTGKNVEWVDVDAKYYNPGEAHEGKRAVKISRKSSDVLEVNNQSEGVESDFIQVIPGNYTFFFDIKLENVFPAVERYEVKISKNIDIHLTFYDKNKKEMDPGIYYHRFGKKVDNSFKGYAFSNFFYIDKFDWGKVLGRTYNNNFSEGDMPDGCAYIKIFFGLKGRGTMYVDNVDFRLSRWNFTSLERMAPLFAKDFPKSQLLVPTPKEVSGETAVNFEKRKIVILTPADPAPADVSAGELLKQKLLRIKTLSVKKIVTTDDERTAGSKDIIFSIGKTSLYQKHAGDLDLNKISGHDQGYIVKMLNGAEGNLLVFLLGNTPVGDYYATTTAVQLLDDKKPVYYHADIVDYPDFTGRSYRLKTFENSWAINRDTSLTEAQKQQKLQQLQKDADFTIASVNRFTFYKLNKIYNDYWSLSKKWWDPGKLFFDIFEGLGKECKRLGVVSTALQINPYYHFEFESEEGLLSDSLRNIFSHSNPADIQKIKDIIQECVDNGAKTVMVCADDFVPHSGTARGEYALFTDRDKKQFFNMANAQVFMMNELRSWLDKNSHQDVRIEFVPAPYLNEFVDYGRGTAEAFFRDLTGHLSKDIAIIWTGNTVRSLVYDQADLKRYTDLIKSKPMLWDNTPYARDIAFPGYYPGKTVMCNLFEAYDIIVPKDFYKVMSSDIYLNGIDFEERYNIKFATFADFTWNNNDYKPDFSLYKVLVGNFGKEGALKLVTFNDYLYKYVSKFVEIRVGMERASKGKPYVITSSLKAEASELQKKTEQAYKDLKSTITNTRLLDQLKEQMQGRINAYEKIIQNKDGFLIGEYFLQR